MPSMCSTHAGCLQHPVLRTCPVPRQIPAGDVTCHTTPTSSPSSITLHLLCFLACLLWHHTPAGVTRPHQCGPTAPSPPPPHTQRRRPRAPLRHRRPTPPAAPTAAPQPHTPPPNAGGAAAACAACAWQEQLEALQGATGVLAESPGVASAGVCGAAAQPPGQHQFDQGGAGRGEHTGAGVWSCDR